jgi:chemotaxis protein histidine kinase CheA
LPLVFLSGVLQLEDAAGGQAGDLNALVLRWDGGSYALVVDAIHGAEDVVVKSLHGCVERPGVL